MGKVKKLSYGINYYINNYLNKNQLIVAELRKNWEKIVGKAVAFHSIPSKFVNGRLFIDVNDNIWIQEFSLRHDEILRLINDHLKKNIVQKLFFKFRYFILTETKEKKEASYNPGIPEEKLKKIEDVVSKIEDKNLREALKHYLILTSVK